MKYLYVTILGAFAFTGIKSFQKRFNPPTEYKNKFWARYSGLFYLTGIILLFSLSVILLSITKETLPTFLALALLVFILIYFLNGNLSQSYLASFYLNKSLRININNNSSYNVNIRIDCRCHGTNGASEYTFQTFEYNLNPDSQGNYRLNRWEAHLMMRKSSSIGILLLMSSKFAPHHQPIQIFLMESPSSFEKGEFNVDINRLLMQKIRPIL